MRFFNKTETLFPTPPNSRTIAFKVILKRSIVLSVASVRYTEVRTGRIKHQTDAALLARGEIRYNASPTETRSAVNERWLDQRMKTFRSILPLRLRPNAKHDNLRHDAASRLRFIEGVRSCRYILRPE